MPVSLSLNFLGGAASAEGVGAQMLRPWEIASSHTDSTVTLISPLDAFVDVQNLWNFSVRAAISTG